MNSAFEGLDFDMGSYYYMIFKPMIFALFFSALVPYGLLLGIIELLGKYYAFKYILVTRSKIPKDMQNSFTYTMILIMEMVILFYTIGYMLFEYIVA